MSSQTVATATYHHIEATLMLTDIARMLGIARELGDESKYSALINDYYSLCSRAVCSRGGEVIKYLGDSCLAMFGEKEVQTAIAAVAEIREEFPALCLGHHVTPTDVRGVIHIGEVISGRFGPEAQRDVMGSTANTLFSMDDAAGITLSEKAYRCLPSIERSPWRKRGGHVTYVTK